MSKRQVRRACVSCVLLLGALATVRADEPAPSAGAGSLSWTLETRVGRVVAQRSSTARIFELVGIDYCCGGGQTLAEAAAASSVDPARLLAALEVVGRPARGEDARDWTRASVDEVIDHVVATHHAYLRRELPRVEALLHRVVRAHAATHPELVTVQAMVRSLSEELLAHLRLEEETVFPLLRLQARGAAVEDGGPHREALRAQHEAAGEAVRRLRSLTGGYEPPADACPSYRALLAGLEDLERDLHRHVHLENNVLLGAARAR